MRAIIAAAIGAEAEVPVCWDVHFPFKSVVNYAYVLETSLLGLLRENERTTAMFFSLLPLLYVLTSVEAHHSAYQGDAPRSVTELTPIV